jgi:plasmid stabilization system protein ParE
MAYKIVWSPEAVDTFESIIRFINSRFTEKEVAHFVKLVNRRLLLLEKFPYVARTTSRTSKRRRTIIHKRTIIYFKIREGKREIELLSIFDTRQKPGNPKT